MMTGHFHDMVELPTSGSDGFRLIFTLLARWGSGDCGQTFESSTHRYETGWVFNTWNTEPTVIVDRT